MLLIKTNQISLYQIFYLIFVFLLTLCKAFGLSSDNPVYIAMFAVSLIFWGVKMTTDRWSKKEVMMLSLLLALSLIVFYKTKQETLLLSFIIFSGIKGVSLTKILKVMLHTRIFGFITLILAAHFGIIPNKVFLFWRDGSIIERYGYGFEHPNLFHTSFVLIIILIVYLYYNKLNIAHLSILAVINYVIYTQSISRTGFLSASILLLMIFFVKKSKIFLRLLTIVTKHIQLSMLGFTVIIATVFKDTSFYTKLDGILSGRLRYASEQLTYIPQMFGRNFENSSMYFDNSYSMLISGYGIIVTVLFLFAWYKSMKTISHFKNNKLVILFFITAVMCFTESFMVNGLMNLTILIFGKLFFNELKDIERK